MNNECVAEANANLPVIEAPPLAPDGRKQLLFRPDEAVKIATAHFAQGRLTDAEQILRAVIDVEPAHAVALHRLGAVLAERGQFYEALYRLDRSVKLNRKDPVARSNYGMVLAELGHHEEGLVEIERSIHLESGNPITWNNKGNTLVFLNRNVEAIKALKRAIELAPRHALSWYNLGIASLRAGKTDEAVAALGRALKLQPGYSDALFNLSMAQLTLGDYENGWRNYEARFDTDNPDNARLKHLFPQPLWRGENIAGKSIMLYGDQGYGNSIMFARYIPMVVATGAKVYCNPHPGLRELFAATFPDVQIIRQGEPMPEVDYRCSFPSLPLAFGTTIETIPAPLRFNVEPTAVDRGEYDLKVGLCWSGNWKHVNDAHRSVPFSIFRRLLNAGADFVSLQQEVRDMDQPEYQACRHLFAEPDLSTWTRTFSLIQTLDLVITVDTAVAHAAATMGVPTWILLPSPRTDWRWLRDRSDSVWYPGSARLIRQERDGDWAGVIERVRGDLRAIGPCVAAA